MIILVSKRVFAYPGEIVTIKISLKKKLSDHANFAIETANPNGWWGSSVPQLPKDVKVPREMIVQPHAGVVHWDIPEKVIAIKYLYPTWIRVVQYLTSEEVPTVSASIAIDTPFFVKMKRWWSDDEIEQPHERTF